MCVQISVVNGIVDSHRCFSKTGREWPLGGKSKMATVAYCLNHALCNTLLYVWRRHVGHYFILRGQGHAGKVKATVLNSTLSSKLTSRTLNLQAHVKCSCLLHVCSDGRSKACSESQAPLLCPFLNVYPW